ncbi:MAG: hypothetical protein JWP84_319 [Tardiphaga sp.]|nr:hypothetical protein [Tardiphaga sp.]
MSTRKKRPAAPKPAIYTKTDVSPETLFQAIGRLRKEAADEIDRLLAFLDTTEPDPDLEPSLGASYGGSGAGGDDRELDDENDEPSLGSSNDYHGGGNQDAAWRYTPHDIHDREGPDHDLEPSLCGVGSHVEAGFGNDQDRECDVVLT